MVGRPVFGGMVWRVMTGPTPGLAGRSRRRSGRALLAGLFQRAPPGAHARLTTTRGAPPAARPIHRSAALPTVCARIAPRAFFYAGMRALLVTHWAVDSAAATSIATNAFANLKADAKLGRAEAMRHAMATYLDDETKPEQAHPGHWGAFAIVGEGVRQ
jgi:hypothetical protein